MSGLSLIFIVVVMVEYDVLYEPSTKETTIKTSRTIGWRCKLYSEIVTIGGLHGILSSIDSAKKEQLNLIGRRSYFNFLTVQL
ncbi:MAG: hypothetical protein MUW51_11575 [Lactococcus lactis]|nr:hypothetical protein [Lactococcus lactis]